MKKVACMTSGCMHSAWCLAGNASLIFLRQINSPVLACSIRTDVLGQDPLQEFASEAAGP